MATTYLQKISISLLSRKETGKVGTYDTYSFSDLVVRTSGSRPRRPTRITFATSDARAADDEKA